jgi:predicted small metal-binding protein
MRSGAKSRPSRRKIIRVTPQRVLHLIVHEKEVLVKKIACSDVVPGCPFTATAETEEDLLEQVATHAGHTHGIKQVTPELLGQLKKAIQGDKAAK